MMKLTFAIALLLLISCSGRKNDGTIDSDMVSVSASASGEDSGDRPEIKFDEEVFDFGRITQGEQVSHTFTFKNTGDKDLLITGASASCGCTVPEWPKQPIGPGKEGKINVVFNSEGKSGLQEKTITVVTNCEPATRVIRIKGDVVVAETAK
jgi:hypothetical protein